MAPKISVRVDFGQLAKPLTDQLAGYLPHADLERFEVLRVAVMRCIVNDLIVGSTARTARNKLMRMLEDRQRELEEERLVQQAT